MKGKGKNGKYQSLYRIRKDIYAPEADKIEKVSIPVQDKEAILQLDLTLKTTVSIPVQDKEEQDFVFLFIIHHTFCFVKRFFS